MADLNEIFNEVEKIKVSIVMQVNLSDYENSRSDAIHKFHRAVESFGNQIYKNCELIIVSDGCLKTQQHYNRSYKEDPRIKFVYYDRPQDSVKMYGKVEGQPEEYTYYRGLARKLGAAVATGDIITYMDSDDIIAPEFTITLMLIYNQEPGLDWWMNTSWYDNHQADWEETEKMFSAKDSDPVVLNYAEGSWRQIKLKPGKFETMPWLLTHRSGLNVNWRDTFGTVSEHLDFNNRLRQQYPNGTIFDKPIYVRCHVPGKIDV